MFAAFLSFRTVNIASRMESTGIPGRVHCTKEVIDCIPAGEFVIEKRGMVQVKGIGEMETYFINEKTPEAQSSKYYWNKVRSIVLKDQQTDGDKVTSSGGLLELLQLAKQLDNTDGVNDKANEVEVAEGGSYV